MPGRILRTSQNVSLADKVNSRACYRRLAYLVLPYSRSLLWFICRIDERRGEPSWARERATGNHEQTVLTSVTFEYVTKCLI